MRCVSRCLSCSLMLGMLAGAEPANGRACLAGAFVHSLRSRREKNCLRCCSRAPSTTTLGSTRWHERTC
jgi:hypothetical protein